MPRNLANIVSPQIVSYFEHVGLFEPALDNKRKISTLAITSRTNSPSSSIQYLAPLRLEEGKGKFEATAVTGLTDYIEIPVKFESLETLEFVGFCTDRAKTILNLWLKTPSSDPRTFLDFTLEFLKYPSDLEDAYSEIDDWESALRQFGISSRLKRAILMPEFQDIRYTASCRFWVLEAIESSYNALERLNQRLEENMICFKSINFRETREGKKRPLSKVPSLPSPTSRKRRTSKEPQMELPQDSRIRNSLVVDSDPIGDISDIQYPPSSSPSSPTKQARKGNESIIPELSSMARLQGPTMKTKRYKDNSPKRALEDYSSKTSVASNEACGVVSGDLSGEIPLTYRTPQEEVADSYTKWRKYKSPLSELVNPEYIAGLNWS
ncbi:hypothetical protein TWF506_009215 [Arthrobotrys conoides]|uniref:Uncharacterized protein n=1 Tax=Arthrobotrys conoides TaxID=74498 RepID=A0AAN8NC36_9PEZI